ncbi:MAG TPA: flagellar filament capping protein FliD, partial [Geminicoccaceae bacterium]|nr:flagellar filament capping protein FliD [Geminicoccaceae bacterium]
SLAAAKEQITGFAAAYNALRDFVAKHAVVGDGGEVAEDAVLFGDRTLRSVAQTLGDLVGSAIAGLDPAALGTLRDVGISLESGGRLRVDEKTLDARLLNKLDEVRRVFEFTATGSSGDLSVYARTNALADLSSTVAVSDPDADGTPDAATIDGVAAVVSGGTIAGAEGTAYEGLKLIWTGRGDAAIDMRVSQGVADRLHNALDEALDLFDGPVQRAIDELGEANRGYAEQVERIEARAAAARERLIERFTAMEAALSVANAMLAQVRAQMDAMNGES